MNDFLVYYVFIFIFGLVIGSFLNVCIYRIPEGISLNGRSSCRSCDAKISWYDLIPLVSYVLLAGRCRKCRARISIQYPLIEALNGLLYVLVFYFYGFENLADILVGSVYCLVISALLALSVIDLRTNTIPLGFNIFIGLAGVLTALISFFLYGRDMAVLIDHGLGFLSVSVLLYLIYLASRGRAIGGGDIKLMAATGLVLGASLNILAFFIGCILAAIIHPLRMKLSKRGRVLAFGPYLAAGTVISMLLGRQIIDWYIQSFF